MDVLSESMRRVTEVAPPTRIDVDALIAGERRRHRWAVAGGATLATAVVAAGLVVVVPLAGGHPVGGIAGPTPTDGCAPIAEVRTPTPTAKISDAGGTVDTVRPAPTEPAAVAEQRLSLAFNQALRTAAPGMTFADFRRPGCELVQFANFGNTYLYEGMALATNGGGTGGIAVHFYQRPTGRPSCGGAGCSYDWIEDLPGGAVAFGFGEGQVHVWRTDGTAIMILSVTSGTNQAISRITLPVNRVQMITIGTFPALTLYP